MRFLLACLVMGLLGTPPLQAAYFSQVFPSGENTPSATVDQYNTIGGGAGWNTTENNRKGLIADNGTLTRFRVTLASAVGAGTSLVLSVRLNGVSTALSCTFNDDVTTTCLDTDEVAATAGQEISIFSDVTNTPATSLATYSVIFLPSTQNLNLYNSGTSATNLSNSATNYIPPHATNVPTTTEFLAGMLMPFSGTLTAFYAETSGAAGSGNSYTFTVRKNATTATNFTCAISGASATTCNDVTGGTDSSFVVGDYLTIESVPASTPTARLGWFGIALQPDDPGVFAFSGVYDTSDAVNTVFNRVYAAIDSSWSTTGANRDEEANGCVAQAIYVNLSADPDNGVGTQSYALTLLDDGSSAGTPTCTVSQGSTTCSQTGQSYDIEGGSILLLQDVPANTPTVVNSQISFLLFNTPRRITGGGD